MEKGTDLILKHPFSNSIIEIVNLKYSKFIEMVKELNSIAEYFLDDNGHSLSFRVVEDTDITFLWKLTVKIECIKVIIFVPLLLTFFAISYIKCVVISVRSVSPINPLHTGYSDLTNS